MKTSSVKRRVKYFLLPAGTLVIFIVAFVAVVLLVCDDDDYRRLAAWGVERFTGWRMIVEGPFSVHLAAEPSLTPQAS